MVFVVIIDTVETEVMLRYKRYPVLIAETVNSVWYGKLGVSE